MTYKFLNIIRCISLIFYAYTHSASLSLFSIIAIYRISILLPWMRFQSDLQLFQPPVVAQVEDFKRLSEFGTSVLARRLLAVILHVNNRR